jgi:phospholipid/cholesterol/gamma-HCH transport system permease protein
MVETTRAQGHLERSTTVTGRGWDTDLLTPGELRVRLYGEWVLSSEVRSAAEISQRLSGAQRPSRISFDARALEAWDNILINFLTKVEAAAAERGVTVDHSGLPGGVQRLVALARAVPERQGAQRTQQRPDLLTRVGSSSINFLAMSADLITFLGEALIGIGRMLVGRARLRRSDLMIAIEDCGPNALPIVALIRF